MPSTHTAALAALASATARADVTTWTNGGIENRSEETMALLRGVALVRTCEHSASGAS